MSNTMFTKATKKKARARVALMGPTGSGKTYTALAIATGLGEKIAVIDTEHGSASKYADIFSFETCQLTSYAPKDYIKALKAADEAGFEVVIIDSLSHEWAGKNGCLEQVSATTENSNSKNSYTAWGKVTPQHNEFLEAILACKAHVIGTLRTKTEYAMDKDERGKTTITKVGLGPVQRDGVEYEFDIVATIDRDHIMRIDKTRFSEIDGERYDRPDHSFGAHIRKWLDSGEDPDELCTKDEVTSLVDYASTFGVDAHNLKEYIYKQYPQVNAQNFMRTFTRAMLSQIKESLGQNPDDYFAQKELASAKAE